MAKYVDNFDCEERTPLRTVEASIVSVFGSTMEPLMGRTPNKDKAGNANGDVNTMPNAADETSRLEAGRSTAIAGDEAADRQAVDRPPRTEDVRGSPLM
mmetsp:Transcript_7439/g.17622  ORF Transcript_7439/g.17622 Transcript_7439/m.17622 type:complete len:99 (+) Transcript_7439:611-907(+)